MSKEKHWFLVPDLNGPSTGGTLYNRELVAALGRLGVAAEPVMREQVAALKLAVPGDRCWVDSLFLAEFPSWCAAYPQLRFGLILHYLPSLLEHPEALRVEDLSAVEKAALGCVEVCVVTSLFMKQVLFGLGFERSIRIVEPGLEPVRMANPVLPQVPSSLMIANLLPGKGILEYLDSLGRQVEAEDRFQLAVIGSHELDPVYAAHCRTAAEQPKLKRRVSFLGALPPEQIAPALQAHHFFVSASRMESYGMALAEARTVGVPILAQAGGNVGQFIDLNSGGELVADAVQLASASLALFRDPAALAARRALARANALAPRSWNDVGRDFSGADSNSSIATASPMCLHRVSCR